MKFEAVTEAISRKFVGTSDSRSFSSKARAKRFKLLLEQFPDLAEMAVLDIGGAAHFWRLAPVKPKHVTLLNVFDQNPDEPWMKGVTGDGCEPPANLPQVDLVISNSVIEHVGGHQRRQAFAEHIRSAAPSYWVQTPNRYFPIEPHYLCPGAQQLPLPIRVAVISRWPLGNLRNAEPGRISNHVMDIELLSATELRFYFPDGILYKEKVAGVTKSFMCVRR